MNSKLLLCGFLSSVVYIILNIICPLYYPGYSWSSQTVSELSAIGAPTRQLWSFGMIVYIGLFITFGCTILKIPGGGKALRTVGLLIIPASCLGLFWPPMHQRSVLAAGGQSLTDLLHIVFTFVTVLLMMLIMGFGAASQGSRFRIYSVVSLAILVVAGIFTTKEVPGINKNLPTPWIGVWERINVAVYMVWIAVLSVLLFQKQAGSSFSNTARKI